MQREQHLAMLQDYRHASSMGRGSHILRRTRQSTDGDRQRLSKRPTESQFNEYDEYNEYN